MLGWTPQTFWKSTTDEFLRAVEGWQLAHERQATGPEPMTMDELHDLMSRHPDGD